MAIGLKPACSSRADGRNSAQQQVLRQSTIVKYDSQYKHTNCLYP